MANPKHVELMLQGRVAINTWRKKFPGESLDLTRADLTGIDLQGAELQGTQLQGAQLQSPQLQGVHLQEAKLERVNLVGANLTAADLTGADLTGANLEHATLERAQLQGTRLQSAQLQGTNLQNAWLRSAVLTEAKLERANLLGADLTGADLTGAALHMANLLYATLDHAILTDTSLWESQRTGWSIKGVICEAVYWDQHRNEHPAYGPGEFERLYADKTKIILRYEGGIHPIEITTLPALIQQIEARYPGCILRLHSIEDGPGGAAVTLVVDDPGDADLTTIETMKAELEERGHRLISAERKAVAAETRRQLAEHTLAYLADTVFPALITSTRPNYTWEIQKMGDINIVGQVGAQGRGAHAHDMSFTQLWGQSQQSIDLPILATQLAILRQHLRQAAVNPEHDVAIGAIAEAEMAAKAGNGPKILEYLSKAGQWALDNAEKIGVEMAVAALKTALGI